MKHSLKTGIFFSLLLSLFLLFPRGPLSAGESIPPHQLKIQTDSGTYGKWAIELWLNDKYVTKLEKRADIDITPHLQWGRNAITLNADWKEETLPVRLFIGAKRGGKWMTSYSYNRRDKGQEVIKQVITVPRGLPEEPAVEGQYIMKVEADTGTMGSWTLMPYINGRQVGTYGAWADADVTPFVIPGRNKVVVKGEWKRDTHKVKLTIGRSAGSSWNTVVNFAHGTCGAVSKSFQFDARGLAAAAPRTIEKNHILKVIADTGTYGKWEIEVLVNGEIVQTVTASTSIDLNEHLKPGKNTVSVKAHFKEDTSHAVTLTIGAEKNGKWATLLSYVNRKKGTYNKEFTIIAK
ncbi:MAG: hypothetical protein RDV48_29380 [Candidatus Eremiobacteraeota bacterium]|nr:hypothetical protein [Candidatus Eremiobacteraeota bacterium]